MKEKDFLHGSLNPKNAVDVIKYNIEFKKEHPEYFELDGLLTFCGEQGSGKTLSLTSYIQKINEIYPKCVIVSNIEFKNLRKGTKVIYYKNLNQLVELFDTVMNGEYGVVYVVDEIQVLFNALLKRAMNVNTLEVISQQRKQRKHIIGTAQIYMKIDKVFREQMKNVILCKKILGFLQLNRLIDGFSTTEENGKLKYEVKKYFFWFHTTKLYNSYDTSKIISAYRTEYENVELNDERLKQIIAKIQMEEGIK